jgi:hypothetical protein
MAASPGRLQLGVQGLADHAFRDATWQSIQDDAARQNLPGKTCHGGNEAFMLTDRSQIVPVSPTSIPQALKALDRWAVWKAEPEADRPERLTKTPYRGASPHAKASHSDPAQWTSYSVSYDAYESRVATGADGLLIAMGDGLAGVDLDDAIDPETDRPTPAAQAILDRLSSYSERSVSGTGIRIFVLAPESEGVKQPDIEIYYKKRFMSVTGCHIPGTPLTIESREAELAAIRDEVEERRRARRQHSSRPRGQSDSQSLGVTALGITDEEIIRTACEKCPGFKHFWNGYWEWFSKDRSAADMKFIGQLAFYCGPDEQERVYDLAMQSEMVRDKWLNRPTYLTELTIPRAYKDRDEYYTWRPQCEPNGQHDEQAPAEPPAECQSEALICVDQSTRVAAVAIAVTNDTAPDSEPAPTGTDAEGDPRPTVILGPNTDSILREVEEHLSPFLFERDGQLVHVQNAEPASGRRSVRRASAARVLQVIPQEQIHRLMSREVRFVKAHIRGGKKKRRVNYEQVPVPAELARLFHKCGQWNRVPLLLGITTSPFMRVDGSLVTTPGYDAESGYLFLDDETLWLPVPDAPTQANVAAAVELLNEVVCDFPFAGPEHRSAWITQLVTVVGRQAIEGPVPMLVIDANRKGTGKSKLARLIGRIVLGHDPTEISFTPDDKELENRLASLLAAGDRYSIFDNCSGGILSRVLDRYLTSSRFDFRRFFAQDMAKLTNNATLAMTGNNLTLRGDLSRRILRSRLVTSEERPEARSDFRHANVEAFVDANRRRIFAAALTILRAHAVAGFSPCLVQTTAEDGTVTQSVARPIGSYNAWDRVVRHAILRAGLPDPIVTQDEAQEEDEDDAKLRAFLKAWHAYNPKLEGSATRIVQELFGDDGREPAGGAQAAIFREAMMELTGAEVGKCPSPKQLGYRLKDARDKKLGGYRLVRGTKGKEGIRYAVEADSGVVGPASAPGVTRSQQSPLPLAQPDDDVPF